MSAPRIARANRSRFLIGLGLLIVVMAFVAIFHNSQQQLDELRHLELRCEQQHDSLNAQVLVAEKSLKSERYEHQQTKDELRKRVKIDKENRDKIQMESNLKYTSLQQHYKLLKSQHDDCNDECAKQKNNQLEEINGLQGKLKSIISQNTQIIREKDREIEHLKMKIQEIENEKQHLKDDPFVKNEESINKLKYKNYRLEKEIDLYRLHCSWNPDTQKSSTYGNNVGDGGNGGRHEKEIEKNFNAQIPVSENLYEIPMKIVNHTATTSTTSTIDTNRMFNYNNNNGVGQNNVIIPPDIYAVNHGGGNNIINSVENFQIFPKPLIYDAVAAAADANNNNNNKEVVAEPPMNNNIKTSTPSGNNNRKSSVAAKIEMPKLAIPTASNNNKINVSSTIANKIDRKISGIKQQRPVPEGVVPVPDNDNFMINNNNKNDDVSENENNRYLNVANDMTNNNNNMDAIQLKKSGNNAAVEKSAAANEIDENGAREVNDNNDFLMDDRNHKDHLQDVLDDNKLIGGGNGIIGGGGLGGVNNNNAAEEDTNLYDKRFNLIKTNDGVKLAGIGGVDGGQINKDNLMLSNNKLLNEIDGDQGKVAAYPDDMHMEEQLEEEDDDEYSNPSARKQDPAVRHK